jgi:hypothetical protein
MEDILLVKPHASSVDVDPELQSWTHMWESDTPSSGETR